MARGERLLRAAAHFLENLSEIGEAQLLGEIDPGIVESVVYGDDPYGALDDFRTSSEGLIEPSKLDSITVALLGERVRIEKHEN